MSYMDDMAPSTNAHETSNETGGAIHPTDDFRPSYAQGGVEDG